MIGLVKLNDRIGDFGAEQVILVRDEASKDKLQKHIGEVALVLTILESKGMEFDDVLAYDFFSGSDLKSSHRCLGLLARGERKQFDSQKHAVCLLQIGGRDANINEALCSELKAGLNHPSHAQLTKCSICMSPSLGHATNSGSLKATKIVSSLCSKLSTQAVSNSLTLFDRRILM